MENIKENLIPVETDYAGIDLSMLAELEEMKEEDNQITNLELANNALRNLRRMKLETNKINDLAEMEISRIKNWEEQELKVYENDAKFYEEQLKEFYRRERELDPKFKLSTPNGVVTSRKQQPKWNYEDELIINSLKKKGTVSLIKTETIETVNKNDLKKEVEIVEGVVSLDGVIVKGIEPLTKPFTEGAAMFITVETGEIHDASDYKYHKKAVVYKENLVEGITIEEREPTITVKVVE